MMTPKTRLELFDEDAGIDALGREDGGGGGGGAVGCEQLEAERDHGGTGHGGNGFGVIDQLFAAFDDVACGIVGSTGLGGDPIERGAECGDERDGGRVGGLAGAGVFALLAEIEIVARIVGGFHAIPGAGTHGEVGQTRRNHDGLLRAANEDVDAPGVHIEVRGAEAGNGVDDEQGFGARVLEQLGDTRGAVADAGGGFGGLHEDGAGFETEGRL